MTKDTNLDKNRREKGRETYFNQLPRSIHKSKQGSKHPNRSYIGAKVCEKENLKSP